MFHYCIALLVHMFSYCIWCFIEYSNVRPRNLEQSTSFATHPRTVTEHLQAPAEDSAFPAAVIHRPAPLWLISEFGAVYKYSDSTQLNSIMLTFKLTWRNQHWLWHVYVYCFSQDITKILLKEIDLFDIILFQINRGICEPIIILIYKGLAKLLQK